MTRRKSHRGKGNSDNGKPRKRIFIATEGVTEYLYFNMLKRELRAGNIDVLKSTSKTSPEKVLQRLKKYKPKDGDIRTIDERWLVIDKDDHDLNAIFSAQDKRKYRFADSNPCFELWLILHCKPLDGLKGLAGSAAVGGCDKVIEALKEHVEPSYHKTKYDVTAYTSRLQNAMKNAERTDRDRQAAWMNTVGTRVYKLADSISKLN